MNLYSERIIDVSVEFLRYLKPSGVKAAYRKRALETHPDRAVGQAFLCGEVPTAGIRSRRRRGSSVPCAAERPGPDFLEKRFKEINVAYQLLQAFLSCPWKYSLNEAGSIYNPQLII